MKSLGIYGDSFADVTHGHYDFPYMDELGWPSLLKKWYNVKIYGKGGSSIYYSYKKFLETYEQHDKIVFIVTDSNRWFIPLYIAGEYRFFNSVFTIDYYLEHNKKNISNKEIDKLNALKNYYLELSELTQDFCVDVNRLFLEEMTELCKTSNKQLLIIFNCYPEILSYYREDRPIVINDYYHSLFLGSFKEDLNYDIGNVNKFKEKRCICHMSEEVNEVLANDIHFALENNKWNPILPEQIKHNHTFDYYYFS